MSSLTYINDDTGQLIVKTSLNLDGDSITKKIINLRQQYPNSEESNVRAWHRNFLNGRNGINLTDFDSVISSIDQCADNLMNDLRSKNYFSYTSTDVKIRCFNAWAAIYDQQTYTKLHHHWPASLAAVYYPYVQHPSKIIFYSAKDSKPVKFEVTPTTNTLLIFQGHIPHEVETMESNNEHRVVIAANLMMYNNKILNYFYNKEFNQ